MRKTAFALLVILSLAALTAAAETYQSGKILKWENSTYGQKSKNKPTLNWVVYQLQTDTSIYSIARQKETKPTMQAGDVVQYQLRKDNKIVVIKASGKKTEYHIVGQSALPGQ